jgi:agmatine/peptidylarginine deiminase
MWVKFLSKKTLVINEITEETLDLALALDDFPVLDLKRMKDNLDKIAEQLRPFYDVVRIPMPIPYGQIFRTYTNALIVNERILVPRFRYHPLTGKPYIDDSLLQAYETEVQSVFSQHGLIVEFIEADSLMVKGGGLRCATSQIPRVDFSPISQALSP